jgi:hypothetical protein
MTDQQLDGAILAFICLVLFLCVCGLWAIFLNPQEYRDFVRWQKGRERWKEMMEERRNG